MKISNKIIFILILVALVWFIKTDYKSIPSKVASYLQQEVIKSSNIKDTANTIIGINNPDSGVESIKKVETPGALDATKGVSDAYLTYDTKNIKLSIAGVLEYTNKYRKENGNLSALKENSKLDFSAEKKLQDMFMKGYFEHVSPDGVGVGDLGNQVSYEYIIIGENLALGNFKDDKALVDAWMASPGHRANILNKRYTEIGIAVGRGAYKGKSVWMAVQHFALPKDACPSIDEVLKGIITIDQENIKKLEAELARRKASIDSGAVSEGMTTNDQIDEYNSLVNDYNRMIINIKEKINKYNEQVRNYNICIAEVE